MRVIPTPYTGSISLHVRQYTGGDLLFYIEDEDLNTYTTQVVDASDIGHEYGRVSFPLSLTLVEGRRYNVFLFPYNGGIIENEGTTVEWWRDFLTLKNAGVVGADITRVRIFCTNTSDIQRHSMQQGYYSSYSQPDTAAIITYNG